MHKNALTTPSAIDHCVKEFCRNIYKNSSPIFIDVDYSYNYDFNECFNNVSKHLELNGGKQVFGWIIWYQPNVYIEAEFHSVWETNQGGLIDVTPKKDGETKILFQPDPNNIWDKKFVPNKRKALCNDRMLQLKIKHQEEIDKLMVKFSNKEGRPDIPPLEMENLKSRFFKSTVNNTSTKRNELCTCGSGKKFKKCCLRN